VLFATESIESLEAQRLGFLNRGVGDEKLQANLSGQLSEQAQSLRVDAGQHVSELVLLPLDGTTKRLK
jgi:hypothetical protein